MGNGKNDLKCVTLNVRGLTEYEKRSKVFKWLLDLKADIIFLQETFCTEKHAPYFNSSWPGIIEHALTDSVHSRGVSILFSKRYDVTIENKHASSDGRLLLLNVEVNGKQTTLINVYANNIEKDRKDLFRKLEKWIRLYCKYKDNLIVAGDMNCCIRSQDRSNGTHLSDKSREVLRNVVRNCRLNDAWANITDDPGHTYIDKRFNTRSRLDYIFISMVYKLNKDDVNVSVCPCVPDHNAVIMKLTISYNERGPGYWKMNNELLKNDTFNTNVRHGVNEVLDNYKSKSHAFVWETIKIRIKELAIRISIQVGKQRNHYKYEMQRELDQINNEKDITDKNTAKRKQELECKLNEIYVKETKGAQLRSKSKYIENGEISFKYFKSLEKTHQSKNVIECLQTDSGEQIYESNLILAECSNFYRDLYKSDCIDNAKIKLIK